MPHSLDDPFGGYEAAAADQEAERQIRTFADADAGGDGDFKVPGLCRFAHDEAAAGDVRAVLGPGDPKCEGQLAGPRGEVFLLADAAAAAHELDPGDGLQGADQDASGAAFRL